MNDHTSKSETAGGRRACDLSGSLITYLYGEAGPEEAALFERHALDCAVCRDELAAFSGVRGAIGAWRADALGPAPAPGERLAPAAGSRGFAGRGRSATAALRAFFALAPRWLQAGAAAAVVAVCALAALGLARAEVRLDSGGLALRGVSPGVRVVEKLVEVPAPNSVSPEQVEMIVAERVRQERLARADGAAPVAGQIAVSGTGPARPQGTGAARGRVVSAAAVRAPRRAQAPRPARRDEQLGGDEELPRLSDLLSEVSGGELD